MRELPSLPGAGPEYPTIVVRGELYDWRFRVKDGELQCQDAHRPSEETWVLIEPGSLAMPAWVRGDEREKLEAFIAEQTNVGQQTSVHDSLDRLVGEISDWQQKTFPGATPHSTATHLLKEAKELLEEIDLEGHSNWLNLREEIADVFHMLIAVANACDVNLLMATRAKFEKNKLRVWGKPDKDGVVEHVAEGCEDAAPARAVTFDDDVPGGDEPPVRVYISGPMSGIPRANKEAFDAAKQEWLKYGADIVITPVDTNEAFSQERYGRPYDWDNDPQSAQYGEEITDELIARDLTEVTKTDTVVVLPGWEKSRGALLEVHTALALKKTVVEHATGKTVSLTLDDFARLTAPTQAAAMPDFTQHYIPIGQPGPIITGITADCDELPAGSKPSNPKDIIGSSKLPLHLCPTTLIAGVSMAMLEGAVKYGRSNFRAVGVRASIYVDALERHMKAWWEGEDIDPDSQLDHLFKAAACLAVLIDAKYAGKLEDDRAVKGGYHQLVRDLTPHVARLKAQHADKHPKHYTIEDEID